jgi:hypothetical protein
MMINKSTRLGRSADPSLVNVSGLQTKGNKHTWQSGILSIRFYPFSSDLPLNLDDRGREGTACEK